MLSVLYRIYKSFALVLYWFLKIENASVGKTSLMVFHVTFVLIMRFAALLLHTELTKTTTESLNQPATATAASSRIPSDRFLEASQYCYFHEILVAK